MAFQRGDRVAILFDVYERAVGSIVTFAYPDGSGRGLWYKVALDDGREIVMLDGFMQRIAQPPHHPVN